MYQNGQKLFSEIEVNCGRITTDTRSLHVNVPKATIHWEDQDQDQDGNKDKDQDQVKTKKTTMMMVTNISGNECKNDDDNNEDDHGDGEHRLK